MLNLMRSLMIRRRISSGIASLTPTIYVSFTGDDTSGDGTEGNPYRTISKAESVALNNDVIGLEKGQEYFERISPKSGVSYTSYGTGELPVVFGGHQRLNASDWSDNGDGTWDCDLALNIPSWLPISTIATTNVGKITNIPNLITSDNGRIFTSSTGGWGLNVAGGGAGTKNHSATEGVKAVGSMKLIGIL